MDTFTTSLATNKLAFMCFVIASGLPSTLLYCAEIWTILWHKPFHNSFYTLFCVRASTSAVFTFITYFFVRIPILFPEWFATLELPRWLLAFYNFFTGYTICFDNLIVLMILANRFTAITRAITHEHIWRKFMFSVLLIVYAVPLYNVGIFWIHLVEYVKRDDRGQITLIYSNEINNGTTLNTYIGIATLWTVVFLALCILINVAVLWAYRNKRKQHRIVQKQPSVPLGNAAAKAKADMIERRLLLFAVISFFGHALFSVYMMTLYFARVTGNALMISLLNSIYTFITDLGFVVLQSWSLLWASASFRKQLLTMFLPNVLHKRIYNTNTITIIKPQNGAVEAVKPMQISSIPKIYN